jgi:hypothetical protein
MSRQVENMSLCKTSFDLWISKGSHDVFALVINLLGMDWELKHITIRLFEASETIG